MYIYLYDKIVQILYKYGKSSFIFVKNNWFHYFLTNKNKNFITVLHFIRLLIGIWFYPPL